MLKMDIIVPSKTIELYQPASGGQFTFNMLIYSFLLFVWSIPSVPRWAIYAILALILLVVLICVLCICVKCCCRRKKKRKKKPDQQINLKGLNGSTTTALVSMSHGGSDRMSTLCHASSQYGGNSFNLWAGSTIATNVNKTMARVFLSLREDLYLHYLCPYAFCRQFHLVELNLFCLFYHLAYITIASKSRRTLIVSNSFAHP